MSPVWNQPRVLDVSEGADWSSGICDFSDDKRECCLGFWCCPCFACRVSRQLGQCLCLPLLDVFSCVHPVTLSMRASVRQQYGIRGHLCRDCLCSTCCAPCVWCQLSRETKARRLPTTLGDLVQR